MTNLLNNFITPTDAAIRLGVSRQRINQRLRSGTLTAAAFGQGRRKEYAIHIAHIFAAQPTEETRVFDQKWVDQQCEQIRADYFSLYETAQHLGLKVQQTEHLLEKLSIPIEQVGTIALQLVSREKVLAIPPSALASLKTNTQRRKGRELALTIAVEITQEAVALQAELAERHHIQKQDVVRAGLSWLDSQQEDYDLAYLRQRLAFDQHILPSWQEAYHISRTKGRNGCTVVLTPCEGCVLERIQTGYSLTTPQALDLAIVAASQSGVIEWWSNSLLTDSETCGKLETSDKE